MNQDPGSTRAPPTPPTPAPAAPRRLVLVGRTGLDARLRQDDDYQLVRARSGVDAIGQISTSDAIDAVILGAGAGSETEARQMIAAMRTLRPGLRILQAEGAPAPAPYDGALSPEDPIEAIRKVIRGSDSAAPGEAPGEKAPREPHEPHEDVRPVIVSASGLRAPAPANGAHARAAPGASATPDAPRTPAPAQPGAALFDSELARAMARGADILGPALDTLRQRTGDPGLRFHTDGAGGVPVITAGREAGRLLSDRLPEAKLAAAADWLGAWLTLRDQHAQLREAAFTDALTGAWNRRYFERFLEAALREARRERHEVTLLVFDIDDFKSYNDAYGHAAGDEILIEATRLMRSVVRPSDRVCRIGGDEFAVIFNEPEGPREPGSHRPKSVMQIAERFQSQIALARFPKLGERAPGPLTVSGGLASFPWDGHDVATLLQIADDRALASKRQGKNAITFGQ